MMQTYNTQTFADNFIFLEGPRWREGRLWTSDIWGRVIYAINENGEREVVVKVPQRPSGIGFLPDGTPLIVSMENRHLYRLEQGELVLHADLSALIKCEINDMVVDSQGRAYVGNMGYDLFNGAEPQTAEITLVEADGSFHHVASELDFPNGLAIANHGTTLYAAESFGHRLSAFDIGQDGSLSAKRTHIELPELVPDGICMDVEEHIWVAGAMGGEFVRVSPAGELVATIDVRPRAAIACQLGGADGKNLYCITYDGGIEDIAAQKPASRIELARVDSAAAGSP